MATIYDVAKKAKVSISTVSRVINDTGKVSPEKTLRVQQAIDELAYIPNKPAQSLMTKKTGLIGFIIPDISNPYYHAVCRGVQDVADRFGYNAVVANSDGFGDVLFTKLRALLQAKVDGLILVSLSVEEQKTLEFLHTMDTPVTLIGALDASYDWVDSVYTDDYSGGALVGKHFADTGIGRAAFLGGPEHAVNSVRRFEGFKSAFEGAGGHVDEKASHFADFLESGGRAYARKLMRIKEWPDAVFAANDLMALGLMDELQAHGCQIPAQLKVVGYDNISFCGISRPQLTTVENPKYEMGVAAADALFRRMETPHLPYQNRCLPVKLVIRESG